MEYELKSLFDTRYRLHKQFYTHKAVISTQCMWLDIMKLLDDELKISESINDMKQFCKFTDTTLEVYIRLLDETNHRACKNLYNRIITRKLYKFIGSFTEATNTKTAESLRNAILTKDPDIKKEDLIVNQFKLGLVGGNHSTHPIEKVLFYEKNKETETIKPFTIKHKTLTPMSSDICHEYVTMVFCRSMDREVIQRIRNAYNAVLT